eukprot:Plantae.Rhodophyta-Palmaria_palmata.ctg14862.p1 GENE.Plantae.Rhodophyta-Palmaria_palmata.ctg14862~~Plantae.Rhodophyta-Palmaria_palmata.ctg14862.p1  ORF type:complete len:146 (+),score=0.07 Plantae.Rhodophyta-Palmaria_palmata.ctg14862:261-698(+)
MFWINKPNGVARMEADNDHFFISASTDTDLDNLSKLFIEAWKVTTQKLDHGQSIEKTAHEENGPPQSFQFVGLKIERLASSGIKISNPKTVHKILQEKRLDGTNTTAMPYAINANLTACLEHEPTLDVKQCMSDVRSLSSCHNTR